MGVPKFYRWLSERYPQINQMLSGSSILPEFDNFYLDMNGIIHACTHPNDNQTANSLTQREMILAIFRYIDRMVTEIVKPKKILFMAIDGCAPRAKLNQQRARRFRAAQDREESIVKARQRGETVDEEIMFDSNCITPGTEFMDTVGKHLRWFIRKKVKDDPIWRNLKIVFSGHDVPGEGEHKIMQFIRDLRADPNYEPNQRHCMYGQDADLIMLGLASHEPHFALLREVVDFNFGRGGFSAKQTVLRQTKEAQFQLLHLSILREYLMLDFALDCHWVPDQERIIDDFIFMTFLVGNDFLPHLPTLDIGEHAFDLLISSYRQLMNESPGYIVHNGEIADLVRLEKLFAVIGAQEHTILKSREDEVKLVNKKRRKYKDAVVLSEEELEEMEDAMERAYQAAIDESLGKFSEDPSPVPLSAAEADEWIDVGKLRVDRINLEKDSSSPKDDELVVNKDYRGRYYYEKFKLLPATDAGKAFLSDLLTHYLKGLMWVLAYYIKGCVSWTWYYPYHYGPMLIDMRDLASMVSKITFTLGQPFQPYQQLLGCLPPASSKLMPRPYQWLMLSDDSPVREFYPLEFGIDQDGKKNPWEAVVLLDFIDEVRLLAAEAAHCPATKLTQSEISRNKFGTMLTVVFDPNSTETFKSVNTDFGLTDIYQCQSSASESVPSLAPGHYFKPELVPGTTYPIAGFPSLTVLPLKGCRIEAVKVNMFGSDSKYKSVCIELNAPQIDHLENLNAELLLGRLVYVNYPQIHEARVVAVTSEREEYRLERTPGPDGREVVSVTHRRYDEMDAQKWKKESHEEETKYLKGRGLPGSGGLVLDRIKLRLRVQPLQGLLRDPVTGAAKKVYASTSEADIPIQLALWAPPVRDTRFEESDELSVEKLMPVGSTVVALGSHLVGCKGRVVGPHSAALAAAADKNSLKAAVHNEPKRLKRVVDVEFSVPQVDPSFGYAIASTVVEEYFSSRDLCASLQISPSVLGKLVGSIKVDLDRSDIGLNLKRNGQYQLLGYARRVEAPDGSENKRKVWTGTETIQIVGQVTESSEQAAAEADGSYWEYSARAAALIFDFKARFPRLFYNLEKLPHQSVYPANQLFDGNGKQVSEVVSWLEAQSFFKSPRTPFSTSSLCKDAMTAIEKAADKFTHDNASQGYKTIVVKGIAVESLYSDTHHSVSDVPLPYNCLEPKLGDRVVNLTTIGVPFGLRGTVVTIHSSTKYVECIFDEEFMGGKGLQGNCSQFRGHLCPWSGLLLSSRADEFKEFRRKHGKHATAKDVAKAAGSKSVLVPSHVKGVVPVKGVAKGIHAPEPRAAAPHATSASKTQAIKDLLVKKDDKKAEVKASPAGKSATLLKALKGRNAEAEAASILNLLKQQLNVTDEEVQASLDHQTAAVKASDGTGRKALAEAAGFDVETDNVHSLLPSNEFSMEHMPLIGVISYQPGLVQPPAAQSAAAKGPAHLVSSADHSSAHAAGGVKKIAINKEASQRVVKHQLSSNAAKPAVAAAAPKAEGAAITAILKNAKRVPAPAPAVAESSAEVAASVDSAAPVPAAEAGAKKSMASILANAKKVLAAKGTAAPAAETAPVAAESKPAATAPVEGKSITQLLANAKKKAAAPAAPAAVAAHAADHGEKTHHAATAHTKVEAPKSNSTSITALLQNAKRAHAPKKADAGAVSTEENAMKAVDDAPVGAAPAVAPTASPSAAAKKSVHAAPTTSPSAIKKSAAPAPVAAPTTSPSAAAKKKPSNPLVPSRVLLSKPATVPAAPAAGAGANSSA